jgi:hypothetical protein
MMSEAAKLELNLWINKSSDLAIMLQIE